MAKPKLGEYGYNPYDTSEEVASSASTAAPPNVPYSPYTSVGGMPIGYGSNAGQTGDAWTGALGAAMLAVVWFYILVLSKPSCLCATVIPLGLQLT